MKYNIFKGHKLNPVLFAMAIKMTSFKCRYYKYQKDLGWNSKGSV